MQEWWKLLTKFYRSDIRTRRSSQKLIAGIVLTGGGAIKTHQAVSRIYYWNGYKNRISNEHLAEIQMRKFQVLCMQQQLDW
jgi:hypothetical protein